MLIKLSDYNFHINKQISKHTQVSILKMSTIGAGGFGIVRRVTYKGKRAAQKTIDGNDQGRKEIQTLRALSNHNNIVTYYGHENNSSGNIEIYMELCDMDLDTYIQRNTNITMKEMKVFMNEIIDAVEYTHSKQVVHRDIKPQNILMKKEGGKYVTKLCDFGIANDLDPGSYLGTFAGTANYMAPEVPSGHYTYSADVYSLGILIHQLVRYCNDHGADNKGKL